MKKLYLLSFAVLFTMISCRSISKMADKGDYDGAFNTGLSYLRWSKYKKTEFVQGVERAYIGLNDMDLEIISIYTRDGNPDYLVNILKTYQKMEDRQRKLQHFLPMVSKSGYKAHFEIRQYDKAIHSTKVKIADVHINKGRTLLESARNGDKAAARRAYESLALVFNYFTDYEDVRELQDEALRLGAVYIAVSVEFVGYQGDHAAVHNWNPSQFNTLWKKFDYYDHGLTYDHHAVVRLENLHVGIDSECSSHNTYSAEVIDRYETKITNRTITENVEVKIPCESKKDELSKTAYSDNNCTKTETRTRTVEEKEEIPIYTRVCATVTTIRREKRSSYGGVVEIYFDGNLENPSQVIPISASHCFQDDATYTSGDSRALSGVSCYDSSLSSFPGDFGIVEILTRDILYNAGKAMKNQNFLGQ